MVCFKCIDIFFLGENDQLINLNIPEAIRDELVRFAEKFASKKLIEEALGRVITICHGINRLSGKLTFSVKTMRSKIIEASRDPEASKDSRKRQDKSNRKQKSQQKPSIRDRQSTSKSHGAVDHTGEALLPNNEYHILDFNMRIPSMIMYFCF